MGLLLNQGADIDSKDNSLQTALHLAAEQNHKAVVLLLLEKGADVDIQDIGGQTPTDRAQKNGHTEVEELLRHRPLVEGPPIKGTNSLLRSNDLQPPKPPLFGQHVCRDFRATIVDFFIKANRECHLVKKVSVYDMLYNQGPDSIMRDAARGIMEKDKPEHNFRWHHLSANNVRE